MSSAVAVSTYQKLLTDISALYENAKKAQVQFAWETGRRIVEVEQDGDFRAQYGTGLLKRLSEDLTARYGGGFSERTLIDMRRLYLDNRISQPAAKLNLSSHIALSRISDDLIRKGLEKRALKEGMSSQQLRSLVTRVNRGDGKSLDPNAKPLPPLKRPANLKLNTYAASALKVKLPDGAVLIDCGFFVNRVMTKSEAADISLTDTPSFTYAATVDRVVDGDTLRVIIDVGFGNVVYDKLRLRGINCPELGTPEGDKAKKYVEKLLPSGARIILKSHKSGTDKYGRFVTDTFYKAGCDDPEEIISDGVYLNQHLLDEGYAVRMAE